jgi:hypothetical protein
VAKGATRGRQDVQIGLQIGGLIQGGKQIKNQRKQIGLAQAQLTQAEQAERNAHARWYFALPAYKQAEYDLGIARQELRQAQGDLNPLVLQAVHLETPRSKTFNTTWAAVCSGFGLLILVLNLAGGAGGIGLFWFLVGLAVAAWIYFVAPRRRVTKATQARALVDSAKARIAAIEQRVAELAPRAVDPTLGPAQ